MRLFHWEILKTERFMRSPICEAKFCEISNGFRPNRGVENALAQAEKHVQKSNLHVVIDDDLQMMESRVRGNSHARFGVGENPEMISKDYLSL